MPDSKPSVVSPETAAALEGVLPRTDLPLSVTAAPLAMPGREESAVAVVLGVRQQVPRDRSEVSEPVKVLAAAFDRNGRSVHSEEQTVGIALPSNSAGDFSYEVLSRLTLKPGRYEIRVALDAAPTQRASVYTYVDVPNFRDQQLSLSGIVLGVSPSLPAVPSDAFKDLLPVVPTAQREFARSDHASVFLRIYQGSKDALQPVGVTARIEDTSGRVLMTDAASFESAQFGSSRAADYRLALPVERLNSGEYLLTVEATQGKFTARRDVRFRVR